MTPARETILKAASRHRPWDKPLGRRHIQQAVAICRHNGLVRPEVLRRAGYNTTKRR